MTAHFRTERSEVRPYAQVTKATVPGIAITVALKGAE